MDFYCIHLKGTTQANNFPVESQSPPKLEPVFPPRGKSKDDRKGPEAEGTPPQPLSSIPDNALRNGVVISRPSKVMNEVLTGTLNEFCVPMFV